MIWTGVPTHRQVRVSLTAPKSTVHVIETPLQTIVFHESRNIYDVRIEKTLLEAIPPSIFTQELLETLFITNSQLTSIDFELFSKLPYLSYCNFSFNKLHTLHFSRDEPCCHRLLMFNLEHNRLEQFDFGAIAHMGCLDTLILRENRLHVLENRELNGTVPMKLSSFVCNELQRYSTKNWTTASNTSFARLNTIDLNGNQLRSVNMSMFISMPWLKDFIISQNKLTEVIVSDGKLPQRLEFIDLSFNRLANADLRSLLGVKTVNLGGNQ
uniref:Leucine rich immune protein (Coil-less) n=1 Tax=Anopheles farauti TaxID=69004 RepID=A0A182R0L9_9DIPT